MSNRCDPSTLSLDDAITIYLRSEYFAELARSTQRKRRGWLRSLRAEVVREGLSETPPPEHPVLPPAGSVPPSLWYGRKLGETSASFEARSTSRSRPHPAPRRSWTTS